MKLALVDSHGLEVVLKPLAIRRVVYAHEKLQNGSYELKQAQISPPHHYPQIVSRLSVRLQAIFYGLPMVNTAVFAISEDQ